MLFSQRRNEVLFRVVGLLIAKQMCFLHFGSCYYRIFSLAFIFFYLTKLVKYTLLSSLLLIMLSINLRFPLSSRGVLASSILIVNCLSRLGGASEFREAVGKKKSGRQKDCPQLELEPETYDLMGAPTSIFLLISTTAPSIEYIFTEGARKYGRFISAIPR